MEQSEKTRKLLIACFQRYPQSEIRDLFKFLHQSAFGCEHLASSLEAAKKSIQSESETMRSGQKRPIEPLDGDYSRVPLCCCERGLSADTLAKLLIASAKKPKKDLSDLLQKMEVARQLVAEGVLPFSPKEFEDAAAAWGAEGYPAVHHSQRFRENYQPSYRVIANEYLPFLPLFAEIDRRAEEERLIVAVEGGSASGKTTLSALLSEIYDCTVFHMDDFFLQAQQRTPERYAQVGGNVDRERFLEEVLQPSAKGQPVSYRKFDCSSMSLGEKIEVEPKKLIIAEGAYSLHPELEPYYDFSVFLKVSPELQKQRIQKRNSPELAKRFFEEWIPLEEIYFTQTKIEECCDLVIPICEDKDSSDYLS